MRLKKTSKLYLGKLMMILVLLSGFCIDTIAQTIVSGKVTNQKDNSGIEGISIVIKGTRNGVVSDNLGGFTLKLNSNNAITLVASGVGFKAQELNVDPSKMATGLNIVLTEQYSKLDEVVVTGTAAGTTKRQLGSYVSSVSSEDLSKGASGNVLAALQGKTAGAQIIQNSGDPAGGMSVRLRGISSVLSSSEPLYIVDGVIINNATNRVTNTSGNYDGGNFVGSIGQNRMVDINPADIERIEVLNGAAAAATYGSRANAGVIQIFTKRGKSGAAKVSFSSTFISSALRKKLDVNQSPTKFGGPTDGVGAVTQDVLLTALTTTSNVTRYDYQDYIFRDASGTDNTLSVSGGNDKTKYYFGGSFYKNQGIIKNTDFQRFSFRSNIDQVINKWMSMNMGLNYTNSSANEKPDGQSFFSPTNAVTIIGNFHDIWTRDANGNIKAVGERGRANPVSVIEDIKQRQSTNRVLANFGLKLKPMKGLTVDYTMGIDNYAQNGTTYIPPYAYNVSPAFYGGGLTLDPTQNGYASTASNHFFQINHDLSANYNFEITNDINSTTQVGYSQQYEKNNYALLQGRGFAPFIETVNGASTPIPGVDERSEISVSGLYVQQNFKFKNQLFLTGAVRRDGSSVFGANQRNQTYAKASASYIISSTEFWNSLGLSKAFDLFKVRVAYGESGNLTGIGAYSRFNSYSSNSFLGRSALNSSTTLANENVKPERQAEVEYGMDLGMFNNRVGLTVNVYNKKVTDLLINRQLAPTNGFASLLDNFGSLENKGYEIMLSLTPVQTKDLKWEMTTIYNHNENKAIKIGQALTLFSTNAGAPVAIVEGQPIGVFYGTYFARGTDGAITTNSAGIPLAATGVTRKVIGNPNPDYTASLVNEVSYKKWNFRAQLDAVQGVDVFNADFRTRQGVGNGKVAEAEQRGLLPRGYVSGVYAIEEWRVDDGSFIKLRELSLSYNVGKVKFINNLSINFSGRNLISWDNYKGYDPEVNSGGQSTLLRGIDFGATPIPRTFSFGIKADF
ncbi:MAG: SusC/RagA family TonB-linked outer membrane protein [Sediminibacterium sp.]|jgi:TonB-linked SusC/RagA family outer membrane protein|nr:SusC/RagA family TonB-linked outer membrane protein [Sediminibacterium sp.]MBP6145398.1 SusC/RagA family TonB-linked outer membrane protein [Sediminibacterium sp.]